MTPLGRPTTDPDIGQGEEYVLGDPFDPTYDVHDPAQRKIVKWRDECFSALGFGPTQALALAMRRDVDREAVTRMVRSGAPHHHVLAIVL